MHKERFYEILRKIPKAEIHLHLEDFIAERSIQIHSLPEFIDEFRSLQHSLREVEDFGVVFYNVVQYMKQNGIVYAEVFFAPGRFVKSGWDYAEIIRFFSEQIRQIKKHEGLTIRLLIDVSRSHGVQSAEAVLDMVIAHKTKEVIGIGLGGDEKAGPARNFTEVFKRAKAAGLRRVAHAGEDDTHQSIIDAIELLGAERIGHGVAAKDDEATMDLLVQKGIPLEVSPTSNVFTGKFVKNMEDHPIKDYWRRGLFITLNTDDPNMFGTSLIEEYWNLYNKLGYEIEHLYRIIINGFQASFMSESKKYKYIRDVKQKWQRKVIPQFNHDGWQSEFTTNFGEVK